MEKQLNKPNEELFEVTDNDRAAHTLSDALFEVEYPIENVHAIISDMVENFFGMQVINYQEEAWKVVCEFERYRPFANMMLDYVCQAQDAIEKLRQSGDKYYEYSKSEQERIS